MENTQKVDSSSSKKVSTSENLKIPLGYQNSELIGEPNLNCKARSKSCEIFSNRIETSLADWNDFTA